MATASISTIPSHLSDLWQRLYQTGRHYISVKNNPDQGSDWWQQEAPIMPYRVAMVASAVIASPQCFFVGFIAGLCAKPGLQKIEQCWADSGRVVKPLARVIDDTEDRLPKNSVMAHTVACTTLPWVPSVGYGFSLAVGYWTGYQLRLFLWQGGSEANKSNSETDKVD